ncbi:ABC transporter permease [Limosilactobacillus sp.]|uniref:ABC transporter permease n=1 Tax=Limosilactobacillus sp. TaxID=2773925 RepID=UPI00345E57E2
MIDLYKKRQSAHFLMLIKYWRLVFNDHFVIALFFLMGALAYGYVGWLGKLRHGLWWAPLLLIIWSGVLLQIGRFATLLQPADRVFLMPQSKAMTGYMKRAWRHSLLLGELITIAGTVVAIPFARVTMGWNNYQLAWAVIAMIIGKFDLMLVNWIHFNNNTHLAPGKRDWMNNRWLQSFVIAIGTFAKDAWAGAIVAILFLLANWLEYRVPFSLDWRRAIDYEQSRMDSIYRFFNLFTDVPSVQGAVKRRRWARGLINVLTVKKHPWSYLYARGFVRNDDFAGLVSRLTIVAMLVVFFVGVGWLKLILTLLFVYVIAGELTPFYGHFDNNAFTHLYPASHLARMHDFQHLAMVILMTSGILIGIASVGNQGDWQWMLIDIAAGIVEAILISRLLMPQRIKKLK